MTTYNDASVTYNSPLHLYGGARHADFFRRAEYSVVIRDFTDAANGDYSPGSVIAFIDNPYHLAWTEYINEVGEAFFTLSQDDLKAAKIADLADLVNRRVHLHVYRNGLRVWGGWLGEIDETATDVIFYGYSYLSGLFELVSSWNQEWTGSGVSTIFSELWAAAKAKGNSRVAWMTTGTIQSLYETTGAGTLTIAKYRASYKRYLTIFKELAAYAISDTDNHVVFEITPDGTFNLWRDRDTAISNVKSSFGHGNVRSFRRLRKPVERRNVLYGVGSSPTDVTLQTTQSDATLLTNMGRSEEPLYFSFVRDATELERVTKLRLNRAIRTDAELFVSFYKDRVVPYRSNSNPDFSIGDTVRIELDHGTTAIAEDKVIIGQQVVYYRMAENVRVLLGDRL